MRGFGREGRIRGAVEQRAVWRKARRVEGRVSSWQKTGFLEAGRDARIMRPDFARGDSQTAAEHTMKIKLHNRGCDRKCQSRCRICRAVCICRSPIGRTGGERSRSLLWCDHAKGVRRKRSDRETRMSQLGPCSRIVFRDLNPWIASLHPQGRQRDNRELRAVVVAAAASAVRVAVFFRLVLLDHVKLDPLEHVQLRALRHRS